MGAVRGVGGEAVAGAVGRECALAGPEVREWPVCFVEHDPMGEPGVVPVLFEQAGQHGDLACGVGFGQLGQVDDDAGVVADEPDQVGRRW